MENIKEKIKDLTTMDEAQTVLDRVGDGAILSFIVGGREDFHIMRLESELREKVLEVLKRHIEELERKFYSQIPNTKTQP